MADSIYAQAEQMLIAQAQLKDSTELGQAAIRDCVSLVDRLQKFQAIAAKDAEVFGARWAAFLVELKSKLDPKKPLTAEQFAAIQQVVEVLRPA